MGKFIYVFSKDTRDFLIDSGYSMLKSDEEKDIYIFVNKNELVFSSTNIVCAFSDTLTF